ncbi:MAG TPA: tRNA (adenosine(37)-N6)-threonylcarbamoyltransferase complex ATPase subunit type 1 TsaE [Devosiaceae bacterium]|nr:tRNA (adenosine(37)-N6)-threonylcarbamoyltransferase complex ATPase subunit type 1 TsaE [Devosiaceae bacterium]
MPVSHFLADDDATAAFAARVAAMLQPGDLVLLEGDLGAGKSALARGIIRTLARDPRMEVPSPSFALVQPYTVAGWTVLHADLYRLQEAGEVEELGLLENQQALVLVEWPDRAPQLRSRATVLIAMAIPAGGAGRTATIEVVDGRVIR